MIPPGTPDDSRAEAESTLRTPVLQVRGVSKRFGSTVALRSIDLDVRAGEIVGLVGENGAGKSTLVNIITGVVQPDSGEILIAGDVKKFPTAMDARAAGMATVFQELALAPHLSAAENLFLGRLGSPWSVFSASTTRQRASQTLSGLGWNVDPARRTGSLPTSDQQLVEIARAIASNARVLLLDEPTSSLASREVEELRRKIKELAASGIAVIYVSHHLGEVFELVDSFAVLRDGEVVLRCTKQETDRQSIVRAMLGEVLRPTTNGVRNSHRTAFTTTGAGVPAFELREASIPRRFRDVTLRAMPGEVLGITGLRGCGAEDVATSLFVQKELEGEVRCFGQPGPISPPDLIRNGIGYVPPERRTSGLFPDLSVRENLNLTARVAGLRLEPSAVDDVISRLSVRVQDANMPVKSLSGGNQQKVLIARWFLLRPRALILVEPTRGVDIGVRHEIHRLLREFAREGLAIVMASLDLEEIAEVCDRILVMHEGQIQAEMAGPVDQQDLHNVILEGAST